MQAGVVSAVSRPFPCQHFLSGGFETNIEFLRQLVSQSRNPQRSHKARIKSNFVFATVSVEAERCSFGGSLPNIEEHKETFLRPSSSNVRPYCPCNFGFG